MFWLLYRLNILFRENILKLIPIDVFEARGMGGLQSGLGGLFWTMQLNLSLEIKIE